MTGRTWTALAVTALGVMLLGSSAAASGGAWPETAIVPLRLVTIQGGQLKVGIELRLGGGAPQLYTFDTGSAGFYAAYNPRWWPSFVPLGGTIQQSYGSGAMFEAEPVLTTVGISTDVGEITAEVEVALITDAWGGSLGPTPERSTWLEDVAAGRPPLYGSFFGDFGSGLNEKNGLFAVLPQLPGNLSSGFAVRLGCGGGPAPTLVLGLTEAVRGAVTSWVPLQEDPLSPPFPNSDRPTYAHAQLAAAFALQRGEITYAFSTDAILDTGGPTTSIHEHGDRLKIPDALLNSPHRTATQIRSGARFRVNAEGIDPGDDFELDLITGRVLAVNQVNVTRKDTDAFVNLGLIPFLRHDVVFDVERGLVGFAPCSAHGVPPKPADRRGPP